ERDQRYGKQKEILRPECLAQYYEPTLENIQQQEWLPANLDKRPGKKYGKQNNGYSNASPVEASTRFFRIHPNTLAFFINRTEGITEFFIVLIKVLSGLTHLFSVNNASQIILRSCSIHGVSGYGLLLHV